MSCEKRWKLEAFKERITVVPGRTNNREVIQKAVAGCDGVLTVLAHGEFPTTRREQPKQYWTSRHVGDPILECNITRRVDFALFMIEALKNDEMIHEAPAIVGRRTPSALAHTSPN